MTTRRLVLAVWVVRAQRYVAGERLATAELLAIARRRIVRALLIALVVAASAGGSALAVPPFFVFDNGVGRGSWTPEQQARTLKELGYDGISYNYTTPEDLARWQQAFAAQSLRIFGLYVHTYLDAPEPFDARLPDAIRMLKGSGTVLWITVRESKQPGNHDDKAVAIVQQVADLARAHGVQVALYGHAGFYVEHAADSARIVAKADRPNLGATINLCHEYMSGVGDRLDATLTAVAPQATIVSINGADLASKTYITRLDQGDFDLVAYLRKLKAAGYDGPIGLQAYNVPGDTRENLAANIAAWRTISAQVDQPSPEVAAGVAASKFTDVKGFADRIRTPLLLQDHNTVVWFRSLKIRELSSR